MSWAILPGSCDDLAIRTLAGADRWLVHLKPDEVARLIDDVLPC